MPGEANPKVLRNFLGVMGYRHTHTTAVRLLQEATEICKTCTFIYDWSFSDGGRCVHHGRPLCSSDVLCGDCRGSSAGDRGRVVGEAGSVDRAVFELIRGFVGFFFFGLIAVEHAPARCRVRPGEGFRLSQAVAETGRADHQGFGCRVLGSGRYGGCVVRFVAVAEGVMRLLLACGGGLVFGFLAAKLCNRFALELGIWRDVVGISVALGSTGLWMWLVAHS
jgi:hypothetical protein